MIYLCEWQPSLLWHIDGLVQDYSNSSALAMYFSLALSRRYMQLPGSIS